MILLMSNHDNENLAKIGQKYIYGKSYQVNQFE